MTDWLIRIESTSGLASTVEELEQFDDLLRRQPGAIEPCASLNTESRAVAASFVVEAADARSAVATLRQAATSTRRLGRPASRTVRSSGSKWGLPRIASWRRRRLVQLRSG